MGWKSVHEHGGFWLHQEARLHGQPCPCSRWNLPGPDILNVLLRKEYLDQVPAVLPSPCLSPSLDSPSVICFASEPNAIGKHLPARTGGDLMALHSQKEERRAGKTGSQVYAASRRLSELGPQLPRQSLCLLCPIPATIPGVWIFSPIKSLCKKVRTRCPQQVGAK